MAPRGPTRRPELAASADLDQCRVAVGTMSAVSTVAGPVSPAPLLSHGARAVTSVAALFWGVAFFGVIDLLVVPLQDEAFFQHYVLEAAGGCSTRCWSWHPCSAGRWAPAW